MNLPFLWLTLGEWRAQPLRSLLAVAAIAIGVALGFAVHLINAAAFDAFASGVNRVRGAADLVISATADTGFDEDLYARLMGAGPGHDETIHASIAAASPVVETQVAVAGTRESLHIVGIDALRAARVTPSLIGRPARVDSDEPRAANAGAARWFDPDAIFVSSATLAALGKKVGDAVSVLVDGKPVALRIAGLLPLDGTDAESPAGARRTGASPLVQARTHLATMDIAGAQWRLGRLGKLSRIDIKVAEGVEATNFAKRLAAVLPIGAQVATPADDRARTDDLSRAYRVNLDMLALMALFTGAFLVYSTQSLSVARRLAQLALLRVVGVTRRGLIAQVVGEGAVLGAVGGFLGLLLGHALAAIALTYYGGDLGGGYFRGTRPSLAESFTAAPGAAAIFFALGFASAIAGSFVPARAAARAAPAVALKSSDEALAKNPPSARIAALLLMAGIIAAFMPPLAGLPIFGYISMALLLFGGIAAMPWLARVLLGGLARRDFARSVAIDLAIRRLWGAPSQAAVALCGIVAAASLMVAMTVMIASFRHSVDAWLLQVLPADLYLRINGPADSGGGFGSDDVSRLAKVAGVAHIAFLKSVPLKLAPDRPPVALIARDIDDQDAAHSLPLVARAIASADGRDAVPIWVSEAMVELYRFKLGSIVGLPIATSARAPRFFIAGVWRDYARQFGAIAMRRGDYTQITGDARFIDAAVTLAAGASATTVTKNLRAALPETLAGRVDFAAPGTIRAMSLAIFDRSFAVTYLLQAVAIMIGLAGVAASFSAQTLARAKEFGMLRHIGVLRRQIVYELATEGALLGAIGVVAGVTLGLAMSQVLIHVVNPQSFHWTMDTAVPWGLLAIVAGALLAASSGTAVLAGRRALSQDAVRAVREDW